MQPHKHLVGSNLSVADIWPGDTVSFGGSVYRFTGLNGWVKV